MAVQAETLDFNDLGFMYRDLPLRYVSTYKDGKWDAGKLVEGNQLTISESSPALHYGQQCFEGLKAYRTKSGDVQLFRVDENSKRLNKSAIRLLMPEVPEEKFIDAVKQVVRANEAFIPPYGSGGTLYLRPLLIGVGDMIGVAPAPEFMFIVFAMPVGAYFKGGLQPARFLASFDYDRAAPFGTGRAKVGGNYAGSMLPGKLARAQGYTDVVYLDPATHTKIEEVGAANFFAITHDNEFVTPKSDSILPSITKYALLYLAEHRLGLKATEGDIYIDQLDQYKEAGACGTAAIVTPVGAITVKGKDHVFYSETEVGPLTQKLYDELVGIQFGDIEAPEGWVFQV
ncbi:MAG: branched-chain amino acid aminotransferase [Defluviitaleaceae bacterium]|nr:branched-chain amino acid aminotransferase [Defluviitaleaceae bacterium]